MPRHEDYDWFMDTGGPKSDPRDIALPLSFEPSGDGMAACIHDANGAIICEAKYNDFEEDVTRPERAMKLLVEASTVLDRVERALRKAASSCSDSTSTGDALRRVANELSRTSLVSSQHKANET